MQCHFYRIPYVSTIRSMSALIQTLTPDGFVIAADGRVCAEDLTTVIGNEAQKVFEVGCANGSFALSKGGAGRIDGINENGETTGHQIDLTREFKTSADSLRTEHFNNAGDYARRLCEPIIRTIKEQIRYIGSLPIGT